MEKENITGLLQEVIDLFGHLTTVNWSEAYTDLDIDEEFELEWGEVGHDLDTIFGDKENLTMLIDYLKAEYHAGHTIDPQIKTLRECLWMAVTLLPGIKKPIIQTLSSVGAEYCNWLDWIDRYFPPEQSKQESGQEEPVKQDNKPMRISAAAKKLATPELQAIKQKLVDAGLIKDGKWTGIAAEFGFLVTELCYTHYVTNGERKAWIECANWAGYDGNIQSARKGIEQHPDMETPITDIIRDACKK